MPNKSSTTDPAKQYREAAAVLVHFSPENLQPVGKATDLAIALPYLAADCTFVTDAERRPQWMLKHTVRHNTLKQFGNRKRMARALAANANRPQTSLQEMLEAYITESAPALEDQTLEQLACTLQVNEWLQDVLPDLPDSARIKELIAWEEWLAPLRYLVGTTFRGRQSELEYLRRYVGVPILPESAQSWTGRDQDERPAHPLLIYGTGGLGKSTLVGKLILDYVRTIPEEERFPIAYVDFDRPGTMVPSPDSNIFAPWTWQPVLLLVEAVRQLGVQYPIFADECQSLQRTWIDTFNQTTDLEENFAYGFEIPVKGNRGDIFEASILYLDQFADLVRRILAESQKPFLLVLDTFEEVQYRSRDAVHELGIVIGRLQALLPTIRVIIAGRAQITDFETDDFPLEGLDSEAAVGFLLAATIQDEAIARVVASSLYGNPLSLKLAAKVVEDLREEQGGLISAETVGALLRNVDAEQVQGFLYRRILDHIHNPLARAIAHPGLVLRRITPELILNVLAQPCNLGIANIDQARVIFDELEREASLVTRDESGALRHRTDIRRLMLEALQQDEPVKVDRIHLSAVEYYEQFDDPRSRAEEIYHRMFTEKNFDKIEPRWIAGVGLFLENAISEVPNWARPYLASSLGTDAAFDVDWDQASAEAWEKRATQRVAELVESGRFERALVVLAERPHSDYTTGSSLHLLEARAFAGLKQWPAARVAANVGISSVLKSGDSPMLLDLYLISAHANEELGNYVQGIEMLQEAELLAQELHDELSRLETYVRRLRINRLSNNTNSEELRQLQQMTLNLVDELSPSELSNYPRILRDLVLELGVSQPQVLVLVLDLLGIGSPDAVQLEALAKALAQWHTELSAGDASAGLLEPDEVRSIPADAISDLFRQLLEDDAVAATQRLVDWLHNPSIPESVALTLIDILQGTEDQQLLRRMLS